MKTDPQLPTPPTNVLGLQATISDLENMIYRHEDEFLRLFSPSCQKLTFTGEVYFDSIGVVGVFFLGDDDLTCMGCIRWPAFLTFYHQHA